MSPEQTRQAAQVMLDSLKSGTVVEVCRDDGRGEWEPTQIPKWDWMDFTYRIAEPKHTKIADLPPVCWVRRIGSNEMDLVCSISEQHGTILVASGYTSFDAFKRNHEYSPDRINWTPFV